MSSPAARGDVAPDLEVEALRRRHRADARARVRWHLTRLGWTGDRLHAEREKRLRDLFHYAKQHSPWHAERLRGVEAITEADLSDVPTMTKRDLTLYFDEIVTDPRLTLDLVRRHLADLESDSYLLGRYHAVESGGSSGLGGVMLFDWDGWTDCHLTMVRYGIWDALTDPSLSRERLVIGYIGSECAKHLSYALAQTFAEPSLAVHMLPVTLPLSHIVRELNESQPTMLQGFPSMIHQLTEEARRGRLRIAPRRVTVGSEPLLPETRTAIEETWDTVIRNVWGITEMGAAAVGCGRGAGMHVSDDLLVIEQSSQGDRVYITNLYNHVLPLIRYEITDEVTWLSHLCGCGLQHRRVADLMGRTDDVFRYSDQCIVHPHIFRAVLADLCGLQEYQVRQTLRGAQLSIKLASRVDTDWLEQVLVRRLAETGLASPVVSIAVVDQINRLVSGKLKRFFPLASN